MKEQHLEPAATIATKLDGINGRSGLENLAEAGEVSLSRACRWRLPKDQGGTGGWIPSSRQQRILDWAKARKIDLKPDDFFLEMQEAA